MKDVEFFNFMMPPWGASKKPHASRWKMTIEEAAKRHPGCPPILSTREVRTLPETDEELGEAMTSLHSMIAPENAGSPPKG